MSGRVFGLFLLAALLLPVAAQADSVSPAWEFSSIGTDGNNGAGDSLGEVFTVGSQNITVDSLGYFFDSSAGMTEQHPVAIYDANGNLVTFTIITSASTPDTADHFLFNEVIPVTLLAGETYVIDGASGVIDPFAFDDNGFTVSAAITVLGDNYSADGGLSPDYTGVIPINDVNDGFWGADFGSDNSPPPVPEPGSLLLLGSGLVAMAGVISRKRA